LVSRKEFQPPLLVADRGVGEPRSRGVQRSLPQRRLRPRRLLGGEPGQGWALARTTLSNERVTISTEASPSNLGILRQHIRKGTLPIEGPDATRVLGELTAAENAVSALNLRPQLARLSGFAPDASSSLAKAATTLCTRATCAAIVDFLGPLAAYANPDSSEATWSYLNLPNYLIGGGTLEIQYNIISERILGLPR
jgi:alkylation response protein AidB-like acyl-CoA dehydrogenase